MEKCVCIDDENYFSENLGLNYTKKLTEKFKYTKISIYNKLYQKILGYNMVLIQIDIPEGVNEQLKIIKVKKNHSTIQNSALFVLEKYVPLEYENSIKIQETHGRKSNI